MAVAAGTTSSGGRVNFQQCHLSSVARTGYVDIRRKLVEQHKAYIEEATAVQQAAIQKPVPPSFLPAWEVYKKLLLASEVSLLAKQHRLAYPVFSDPALVWVSAGAASLASATRRSGPRAGSRSTSSSTRRVVARTRRRRWRM